MINFWTLTGYEYKKLFKRKIVWITLAVLCGCCVLATIVPVIGTGMTEGDKAYTGMEILANDRIAADKFEGQEIGSQMFRELAELEQTDSQKIPDELVIFTSSIANNFTSTIADNGDGAGNSSFTLTENELYQFRDRTLEKVWAEGLLTEREKEVFRSMNQELGTPFTYHYTKGYKQFINMGTAIAVMQCLMIAICIPLIFADEHHRRTAQINLCSKCGRRQLFASKIFVGATFSVIGTMILYAAMLIPIAIIYGMGTFQAPIQLAFPFISWDISVGQAALILFGLGLLAAVLVSMVTMFLAEKYRGTTAPMGIIVGFTLFTVFFSPSVQDKVLNQIWGYFPANLLIAVEAFNDRLIHVFGYHAGTWQSAPVFYIFLTMAALFAAYKVYSGYQAKEK